MAKSLGGGDLAWLDVETRGGADAVKQGSFGARHPYLAASFEAREQGRATLGIEVGGNLVEQEDGRGFAAFGDQFGMPFRSAGLVTGRSQ